MYLTVILICLFLVIRNVEHHIMCLLATGISPLDRSSAHFFDWIVCFSVVELYELFV